MGLKEIEIEFCKDEVGEHERMSLMVRAQVCCLYLQKDNYISPKAT